MSDLAAVIDSELLPKLLRDFERLIGLAATLDLVRVYGGVRIFIPTPDRASDDHSIAKVIGHSKLLALAEVYGGEAHFAVPKAEQALLAVRNARIAKAYATHKTARELAVEHRLTERQIERIVAAAGVTAPVDRRQATLF
ncbi:Mor transcription activator family protein [Ottowia sp. VDI28]|uniref:Mor transcription activator family protein n=1 Tax=Ottowia sp. VDI28 TaxID=3133968 RepID=UPI003C304350